jgi:hypothetical protein
MRLKAEWLPWYKQQLFMSHIRQVIHKNGSFPHCLQIQAQWNTQ